MNLDDRFIRIYFFVVFGLYLITGFVGTIWVLDPFAEYRIGLVTFLTVPTLLCFASGFIWNSHYWRRFPRLFGLFVCLIFLSLFWSQMVLLNAVSGDQPELVSRNVSAMTMNMSAKRGGFGWIYRTRW